MKINPQDVLDALSTDSRAWDLYGRQWDQGSDAELQDLCIYLGQYTHERTTIETIIREMPNKNHPGVVKAMADSMVKEFLFGMAEREPIRYEVKSRFMHYDRYGRPVSAFDMEIVNDIIREWDVLIVDGMPYYYDGTCYVVDDLNKLHGEIQNRLDPAIIKAPTVKRIYDLLCMQDGVKVHYSQMNAYPAHWVCFRNGLYDPRTGELHPHDPKYREINPIPHTFEPGRRSAGDNVDAWLRDMSDSDDDVEMLLEYAGYCMTHDMSQQVYLLLVGASGSGKSTVINMIEACVGEANKASVPLSQIGARFANSAFIGKLLNSAGETKVDSMEDLEEMKRVTGGDTIRVERKGKDAFDYKPYTRFLFSANETPMVKGEITAAVYRRTMILPMNRSHEINVNYADRLHAEIGHFIDLAMDALGRMYERGHILKSANSEKAVIQMRQDSDPIQAWLDQCVFLDAAESTKLQIAHNDYCEFCIRDGRRYMSLIPFSKAMREKGFDMYHPRAGGKSRLEYIRGIKLGTSELD